MRRAPRSGQLGPQVNVRHQRPAPRQARKRPREGPQVRGVEAPPVGEVREQGVVEGARGRAGQRVLRLSDCIDVDGLEVLEVSAARTLAA